MRETGHKPSYYYAQNYKNLWRNYRSFAILRNPIDRFLSSFNYACMEKSFWHNSDPNQYSKWGVHPDYTVCTRYNIEELIYHWRNGKIKLLHPCWQPQIKWITRRFLININYLTTVEHLDRALSTLAPDVTSLRLNQSLQYAGLSDLSSESLKFLLQIYRVDLKLHSKLLIRLPNTNGLYPVQRTILLF
jgi:hypothetical protein